MFSLARGLDLPNDAITQKLALLARSGAGKTYCGMMLTEQFLASKSQVIVLDPVGVWYGLRLQADGKKAAFDIPVLGGEHGDIGLVGDMGAAVAEALVTSGSSAVLDVSSMRKGDRKRFVTDFAEEFFHKKKTHRSPVHLIVEEAQVFIPQRSGPEEARMLGAMEDLCKLGRNYGVGYTLISQRPQAVNKDVLNQVECLILLQMTGPHERKAVKEWASEVAGEAPMDIDTVLPALNIGEAVVWSPAWLRLCRQVKLNKKTTYDASATPVFGSKAATTALQVLDMGRLKDMLKSHTEKLVAADPKVLRKQLAQAQAELAAANKRIEVLSTAPKAHPVVQAGITANQRAVLQKMRVAMDTMSARLSVIAGEQPPVDSLGKSTAKSSKTPLIVAGTGRLKSGARRMLMALTTTRSGVLSKIELATLTGLAMHGGTFQTYLGMLRRGEHVRDDDHNNDLIILTERGRAEIAGEELSVPKSSMEVISLWEQHLKDGAVRMLRKLVEVHPKGLSKNELAVSTNVSSAGGTFQTYLGALRRNGLAVVQDDTVLASPSVFPEKA